MEKNDFLKIVSNFNRDDFREYLYKDPSKKKKLLELILYLGDKETDENITRCNK